MNFVDPISPLGIHVDNIDLTNASETEIKAIKNALAEHGLLIFPKQTLTDPQLVEVAEKIGPLEEAARRLSKTSPIRTIANLTNLKDENNQPLGFAGNTTDVWHSDQEYRLNPATLSILYCVIASPVGGNTSFASARVDDLPVDKAELKMLAELERTCIPIQGIHNDTDMIEVSHALVQVNPVTSRKSFYLSENTVRFPSLSEEGSQELKHRLINHIVLAPTNIYSHFWRMGDLVLFDNTQLIHRRESFEGLRWLKAVKIYASPECFAAPKGRVVDRDPEHLYGKNSPLP